MSTTDTVKNLVNDSITLAVVQALSNDADLIPKFIAAILDEQVELDANEKPVDKNSYSYSGRGNTKVKYIDYVCKEMIKDATKNAVRKWMESNLEQIEKGIQEKLNIETFTSPITKAVVNTLAKAVSEDWRFNCQVNVENPKVSEEED